MLVPRLDVGFSHGQIKSIHWIEGRADGWWFLQNGCRGLCCCVSSAVTWMDVWCRVGCSVRWRDGGGCFRGGRLGGFWTTRKWRLCTRLVNVLGSRNPSWAENSPVFNGLVFCDLLPGARIHPEAVWLHPDDGGQEGLLSTHQSFHSVPAEWRRWNTELSVSCRLMADVPPVLWKSGIFFFLFLKKTPAYI